MTSLGLLAMAARGQTDGLELQLRDGTVLVVRQLTGDPARGFEVDLGGSRRRLAAADLIAVLGTAAAVPMLPAVHLAGGDVLRGAIAGGDAGGNRVELLSPVFGRVPIAVDRITLLAAAAAPAAAQLRLPDGVDEALFVRATIGFDLLAGALHQFGEPGVRFQVAGSDAPRWFGSEEFVALRLRTAEPRAAAPAATLLTRVGDRLGVTLVRWSADGVALELEGGTTATLRGPDLGALAFHRDVVFLSDLEPAAVAESGFDGEVVHAFRRDQNVLAGPLVTAGRSHAKGIGVHSRSQLSFRVPAGTERFWTRVGFDDSATALGVEPRADVRVLVGDRVVFERKDVAAGQPPLDAGMVVVRAGELVTLVVDPGRGRDVGDRVNWLCPVFLPAPARRP